MEATLNMLRYAHEQGNYDFYWLISGQDWPLRPMNEILDFFEEHRSENFMLFWNSKNHGTHLQNNLDKRNSIYFPLWMIGRKFWQKVIKRGWVELSGGYNKTYKIFERTQLNIKYYFGSSWWALNRMTVDWILEYLAQHKEYYQFYQNSTCPDESFFQTLVMLSPYANENTDYLTYLRFQKGANSPDILQSNDFQTAAKSKYLIMRKVDMNTDDKFLTC